MQNQGDRTNPNAFRFVMFVRFKIVKWSAETQPPPCYCWTIATGAVIKAKDTESAQIVGPQGIRVKLKIMRFWISTVFCKVGIGPSLPTNKFCWAEHFPSKKSNQVKPARQWHKRKIYQIFMAQFKSSTAKFDARFAMLIVDPPICPTSVLHSRMAHCNTKQNKHGFSMRDCRMFPVILNVLLCPLSFMISPKFWKCTRCKMYTTWSGIPWSLQNAGWRTRSNAMITRELDVTRCSSGRPGWNPCCSSGRSAFKNWSRRPSGRHAAVIVEYAARHASHAVPWSCRSASCSWFCRNVGLSLPWRQCSPMSMRFLKRFFNASQNERYAKSLYPIHRANVYSQ